MPLTAIALKCTLKSEPSEKSSTDAMIEVLRTPFEKAGVTIIEVVRVAALNIKPGVTSDEGEGDDWPALRAKILAADILIFGGPIWLGQVGSVAKRVMERMDAFLDEADDKGRMPSWGKVAVAAIVGNEDGAHMVTSQVFQALNDVGWTIPAIGAVYWVGEAYGGKDFKDLLTTPSKVTEAARQVASNAAHLAGLLKSAPYPG